MAANHRSSLLPDQPSDRRDGRLKGRAQQWLTRKLALGFLPAPRSEEDCRQRFHMIRNLYADGAVILAERKAPSHDLAGEERELFEQLRRELEETRLQLTELRSRSGLDALIAVGAGAPRLCIERTADHLRIQIRPWRSPFVLAILPLWGSVALVVWISAVMGIFGQGPMLWGPVGGLLVGVPFTALLWFSALYWLWTWGGTETVTVTPRELRVEGALLEWRGELAFPLEQVEHLRYSRPARGEAWGSVAVGPAALVAPTLALWHAGRTWRFGGELDESAALAVIAAIESFWQARSEDLGKQEIAVEH